MPNVKIQPELQIAIFAYAFGVCKYLKIVTIAPRPHRKAHQCRHQKDGPR
jgi:hypothetical protein